MSPPPADAGGTTTPPGGGLFPPGAPWTQDVSAAALDGESGPVITELSRQGWGTGIMQIDFSIGVQFSPAAPLRTFTPTADFYTPDCDNVPMPVPAGGAVEGETGYTCAHNGDCHLIVVRGTQLYEMWRANIDASNVFHGGCLAVWDLTKVYPPSGRGDQCTSADAAGYPIAALLFTADEVKAGHIDHAIRFILPNDHMRPGFYVHPATHSTNVTGAATSIPYGAHLRLKNTAAVEAKIQALTPGARVVARAMQKYGMFLADGGNIALTAADDRYTTAKWSGLLGPRDLQSLLPGDFEMVAGGTRIPYTGDCAR